MRLKPEQLSHYLQKSLAAVYFITGDEPLQVCELMDAIRQAAAKKGFQSREVFFVDSSFNWDKLAFVANSNSLFSDKKIIDLRLSGTIEDSGKKALIAYCKHLPEDTILLITSGKLKNTALKSDWICELDKVGIIIQVWVLEKGDLIRWLKQRLQQRGLQTDAKGLATLASRIEGNLLAAAQEIEKLYVLYGSGKINSDQILDVVTDSSRYDVFNLGNCLLSGDINRTYKILNGLKAEGVAEPLVLWAITGEARSLAKIKSQLDQGQKKDVVFRNNKVWDKNKQITENALGRLSDRQLNNILILAAKADHQIKGQQPGAPWETILKVCLLFSSLPIFQERPD
jgi:DNA polymerase-3 subunit delta